jgi:hypothetical protein
MLIILGFDSFDFKRHQKYDTPNFDEMATTELMETPSGLKPSELSTVVLWASMLAGENPKDLYPEYYQDEFTGKDTASFDTVAEGKWNSRLLNLNPLQTIEKPLVKTIPSRLNEKIKERLNKHGVEKKSYVQKRFENVPSVLDHAESPRLISMPGFNWDDSNFDLKDMVSPYADTRDGDDYHELQTDPETFERKAYTNDADRLVRTLYSIERRNHEFLLTHFFSLDLVQHVWVESDTKMAQWYGYYDYILGSVLNAVSKDDTVVVVSDHGMQSTGTHSTRAVFASSRPIWNCKRCQMEDLADVLVGELDSSRHEVRSDAGHERSMSLKDETAQHLKDLGYF